MKTDGADGANGKTRNHMNEKLNNFQQDYQGLKQHEAGSRLMLLHQCRSEALTQLYMETRTGMGVLVEKGPFMI